MRTNSIRIAGSRVIAKNAAMAMTKFLLKASGLNSHVLPSESCIVISKKNELKCSPCYSPTCVKNFVCMKRITVDEVLEAMRPYLNPAPSKEVRIQEEGAG